MRNRVLLALLLFSVTGLVVLAAGKFFILQNVSVTPNVPLDDAQSASRVITDLAGRKIRLPRQVNRIVLLRGMGLYDLAALLGDEVEQKLIGWDSSLQASDRDAYERFVQRFRGLKAVPLLGDSLRNGVSAEAVLALRPDVVIGGTYMIGQTATLDQLEQARVPVVLLSSDDPFRDPQESLKLLGQVFGQEQRAAEIVDWVNREISLLQKRMERLEGPIPSIYLEAGNTGPEKYGNTFGSNLQKQRVHWGSLLSQLRCQNVGEEISGPFGMGVIQPEYLLTRNPDVIVITGACWTAFPESLHLGYGADQAKARQTLSSFLARPGWSEMNAVKSRRVYGLNTRLGAHIMSFAAAQQLAQWLYPDEFKDLDPVQRLQEFHERFMPIPLTGTWMTELEAP